MRLVSRLLTGVVGLSMLVVMTGCAETTGAAVGAGAGAAIGAGTGYGAGKGALIGAGTGAVAGGIYDIVKHR
jgi:YmgG-like glycine-zipper protein